MFNKSFLQVRTKTFIEITKRNAPYDINIIHINKIAANTKLVALPGIEPESKV